MTIANCYVSGFDEGTLLDGTRQRTVRYRGGPIGRIKLGTEAGGGFRNIAITNCVFEYCRGLALEQVDGSFMEDIVVSNLVMRDIVNSPLFIRLGGRLRRPDTTEPGRVRRIAISNVVATMQTADHGILIAGLPGYPVEDVLLQQIHLTFPGGGTAEQARREVPELAKAYPEPYIFGTLPSWGLFARDVSDLRIRELTLSAVAAEARPVMHLERVRGGQLTDLTVRCNAEGRSVVERESAVVR